MNPEPQTWPIDRLRPYDRNPRKNDQAVERLAGLIERFGFLVPIVARSDGEILAGHVRLKAAQHLGLVEVPVIVADYLTPEEAKAWRIADNASSEWSEWDDDLLKLELVNLQALNFDLALSGIDAAKIAELMDIPIPMIDLSEGATGRDDLGSSRPKGTVLVTIGSFVHWVDRSEVDHNELIRVTDLLQNQGTKEQKRAAAVAVATRLMEKALTWL